MNSKKDSWYHVKIEGSGLLIDRNKTAWRFSTAKKFAIEFANKWGDTCHVIDASEPTDSTKPLFTAKGNVNSEH